MYSLGIDKSRISTAKTLEMSRITEVENQGYRRLSEAHRKKVLLTDLLRSCKGRDRRGSMDGLLRPVRMQGHPIEIFLGLTSQWLSITFFSFV